MSERFKCWTCVGTGYFLISDQKEMPKCPRCHGLGYTGDIMDYVANESQRQADIEKSYERNYVKKRDESMI